MQVWMQVQRDPNYYGQLGQREGVEQYDSLKEAKDAFWRECDSERLADAMNHEALVFFYDPREKDVTDPYPDRILRFGPRGGVKVEYA